MFDALSDRLQSALGDLSGRGKLDEEAISRAMREIRLALLEADVNFEVVKDFVAQVRERTLGQEVLKSLTAGQQVVKAVHEELTALMGSGSSKLAMTGQEAVNVALAFQERIAFDGVLMTKLDGDARGGAALSVKAVTGRPIKLISVGEKLDQLEYFHPDRMASRILGMGDVLTLIERAEAAVEEDEQKELEARMLKGQFSFDDFLKSYKMLRRMGPLQGILKLIPGLGKQLEGLDDIDEKQFARVEAIILSMTPQERALPKVIDGSRRQRIAGGSGTTVEEVNRLLEGRKQMEKVMKGMSRGKLPELPGAPKQPAQRKATKSNKRKKRSKTRR